MKTTCRFLGTLALAIVAAVPATAQDAVSVNVGAGGNSGGLSDMLPTEVAGAFPKANWNDFSSRNGFELSVPSSGATPLVDSNGAVVPGMSFAFAPILGALQIGYNYGPDGIHDPDLKLMSGFVRGGAGVNQNLAFTVSNIPYLTYDLLVYADPFGSSVTEYTVNGDTYYGVDASPGNFIVSNFQFSQFTTTSLAAATAELATPSGNHNYIRINGLTGANLSVSAFLPGEEGIQGFQIIDAGIPEPSTIVLAGLAVAAIAVRRRRGN